MEDWKKELRAALDDFARTMDEVVRDRRLPYRAEVVAGLREDEASAQLRAAHVADHRMRGDQSGAQASSSQARVAPSTSGPTSASTRAW